MRRLLGLLVLALVACLGWTGNTLVLYEDESIRETHSLFFAALQEAVSLEFRSVSDPRLSQLSFQESNFTGILLLAPSVNSSSASISVANVQTFLAHGGSLFLAAASPLAGTLTSEVLHTLGFDHDRAGAAPDFESRVPGVVVDHVHHAADDVTLVRAANTRSGWPLHGQGPLLFRGVGLRLNPSRPTAHALVRGSPTAFIRSPTLGALPYAAGSDVVLVGAWTGPRGARAVVSGSLAMLGNELAVHSDGRNAELAPRLALWALGATGRAHVTITTPEHVLAGSDLSFTVAAHEGLDTQPPAQRRPLNLSAVSLELVFDRVVARLPLSGLGRFAGTLPLPHTAAPGEYTLRLHTSEPGLALMPHHARVTVRAANTQKTNAWPAPPGVAGLALGAVVAALLSLALAAGRAKASKTE